MTSAIIVAAGRGTRMGPQVDKLFLPVAGRPLLTYAWEQFDRSTSIEEIIMVVRDGMQSTYAELAVQYNFRKTCRYVTGGKERQDSVWNGLMALSPSAEFVAIQDAARPLTSQALIEATIEAARAEGAAVAAQPVVDTIKSSPDGKFIGQHLDRSRLWSVQTPQTFRVEIIRRALSVVRERGIQVTDDTAACEHVGQRVRLVHIPAPNPKVTVPADVPYVELLLKGQGPQ